MTENSFSNDRAALLIIGNEVLSGRTHDANTPWIAEKLTGHGIVLGEVRIVQDVEDAIVAAVNALRPHYAYVFTTGGIGPTHDDITTASIAKAFGIEIERNAEAFRLLENHYGLEELNPPRAKMSLIPVGASLIPNPVSAAPGFIIENVYVMAGVPRIMQSMFDYILATIKAGTPILSNTVTCNLRESEIAEELSALQDAFPDVQIGSYPHYRGGSLGLSLVLRSTQLPVLEAATAQLLDLIRKLGGEPRALSIRSADGKIQRI